MTRRCNDKSMSTEMSLWLRDQPRIASSYGFVATNIDYVWQNYKTHDWIFIEEKRYMSDLSFSQEEIMGMINNKINDNFYLGMYLVVFEKTSPEDGKIFIEKIGIRRKKYELTKEGFFMFLEFDSFFFADKKTPSKINADNMELFITDIVKGKYAQTN